MMFASAVGGGGSGGSGGSSEPAVEGPRVPTPVNRSAYQARHDDLPPPYQEDSEVTPLTRAQLLQAFNYLLKVKCLFFCCVVTVSLIPHPPLFFRTTRTSSRNSTTPTSSLWSRAWKQVITDAVCKEGGGEQARLWMFSPTPYSLYPVAPSGIDPEKKKKKQSKTSKPRDNCVPFPRHIYHTVNIFVPYVWVSVSLFPTLNSTDIRAVIFFLRTNMTLLCASAVSVRLLCQYTLAPSHVHFFVCNPDKQAVFHEPFARFMV